jgi:2-polyprenyl-3-methyl-5-hydroxy-6-metoxy-1,4-benzoquinol methylase
MDHQTLKYYSVNASEIADRYESVVSNLSQHFETAFISQSKVLDVGCGSGRDLAVLSKLGHDCYGVDATEEFVALAQKLHPELTGRITCNSLPNLGLPFGGGFDAILCSAVLMHVSVEDLVVSALSIKQCLNKHGRVLYSVPSKRLDVVADDRDAHGRLFIPDQSDRLQSIFANLGFQVIEKWGNSDSMGRDSVEWESVLVELA